MEAKEHTQEVQAEGIEASPSKGNGEASTEPPSTEQQLQQSPPAASAGRSRHKSKSEDDGLGPEERSRDNGKATDKRKSDSKEKGRKKERHDKHRHRTRSRSRSRSRERRRGRRSLSQSKSREKTRRRSRSSSRERKRRHAARSRSKDRHRGRRSRSRSPPGPRRRRRSRSRSSSDGYGGYVPRKRQEPPAKGGHTIAGYSSSNDPFYYLRQSGPVPSDPQEALRLWQEQQLKSRQVVLAQQAASAAAAASKTQREVYVGNLMPGLVTEAALRQLFNSGLAAAFPGSNVPGLEPVASISMHSDGRYAFVELRTPEMATAALQLSSQISLLGQSISIGRPSGYVDPAKAHAAAQAAAVALAAFSGSSPTGAVAPVPTNVLMPGLSSIPTPYVCVTGVVTAEVLSDDQEYKDVIEDLREECGKYGQVIEVKVPRPPVPQLSAQYMGSQHYGQAFIQFLDNESAIKAREAIHGRMFAGSTVQAVFVTAQSYATAV